MAIHYNMAVLVYPVRARNTAAASANRIHDDAVARDLGFRGGLVPGVDLFAYLCHLPAREWGRAWLDGGRLAARFSSPVYDGDRVEARAHATEPGVLDLELVGATGEVHASARAARTHVAEPPHVGRWPGGPLPANRCTATREVLETASLGAIRATFRAGRAPEYLDDIGEDLALFRSGEVAHPGWLLRFANRVLSENVQLGPWIHVSSDVVWFSAVEDGDEVETRALVAQLDERKGHQLVELDVLQLVGDRPVARITHVAIYRPRGT